MYSPDRQGWWDGSRWLPASAGPAPAAAVPDAAQARRRLRFVPGFAEGWRRTMFVASIFYVCCAVGVIAGAVALNPAIVGFYLGVVGLAVAATYLVWFRGQPRRMLLVCAVLLLAAGTWTASAANVPS